MLNWKNVESLEQPLEIDAITTTEGVYLRKDIKFEDDKYKYKEVLLSNDYRYDILDTDEYRAKLLEVFKIERLKENEITLAEKKTITTTLGEFSIKTPTYDFIFCLMGLKDLPTGIAEGTIRLADGTPIGAMTQPEVQSLYFEVFNAIAQLDSKFTGYKKQILEASNFDELEEIEIVY
jgi:hypothetical protein